MDYILTEADHKSQAKQLWTEFQTIMSKPGMTMKKFKSHCAELRTLTPLKATFCLSLQESLKCWESAGISRITCSPSSQSSWKTSFRRLNQ